VSTITPESEAYPGQQLGLPQTGHGSLASWRARVAALVIDWAVSMLFAVVLFGRGVLTASDWRAWMTLSLFFVQTAIVSTLFGGSFGQILAKIAVVRLDHQPLGFPRGVLRALLVSLALPALIIGPSRRGLQDYAAGTVVVNRK
jgi:uncharacterized RDD family membrane protein YckC